MPPPALPTASRPAHASSRGILPAFVGQPATLVRGPLAVPHRQGRPSQPSAALVPAALVAPFSQAASSHGRLAGFSAPHVKPLVGQVVQVSRSSDDETHAVFSNICLKHGWQSYIDVRGKQLEPSEPMLLHVPAHYIALLPVCELVCEHVPFNHL